MHSLDAGWKTLTQGQYGGGGGDAKLAKEGCEDGEVPCAASGNWQRRGIVGVASTYLYL